MTTTTSNPPVVRPNEAAARSQRVADARSAFRQIKIVHPRQEAIIAGLDEVRRSGIATRGERQYGITLLAESGSGKTTAAEHFRDGIERLGELPEGSRPVLIVKLMSTGTARSLFSSILQALDDPFYDRGTEPNLHKRAVQAIKRDNVQLLVIDEIQHLSRRSSAANHVTDSLKTFLDSGLVPIAFFGTHDADKLFQSSHELNGRLFPPLTLPPLDWWADDDRDLFLDFVEDLDAAMVDKQIMKVASGLVEEDIARPLCLASSGIIGRTCRIVETAAINVVRGGRHAITRNDLAMAVNSWAIAHSFIDYNPFVEIEA